jgi:hypothetical protein
MREPNALIACADHSRMKSAWAQRPVRPVRANIV